MGIIKSPHQTESIALVYDRVNKWGGAERVLLVLNKIFPKAPLFTAFYSSKTSSWAKKFKVIPSFLNKLPLAKICHEIYPWLTPLAFESFDFSEYNLVISTTSADAKGIVTKPSTVHICYCLTPTRYLWSGYEDYFHSKPARFFIKPVVAYLRRWDRIASQRPDVLVAISENVKKRIEKYYQKSSLVIYPPVDIEKWRPADEKYSRKNYYLVVSRLVKYKKVDLAIKAFNQLRLQLKIVGVGREENKLKRTANSNIEFLGQLTDEQLLDYYQNCKAVVFPQVEDFGLVPLEAQACGRPVVAYRDGGALESVVEGETGLFFSYPNAGSLIKTVKGFELTSNHFSPIKCRENAEKFSEKIFERKMTDLIGRSLKK